MFSQERTLKNQEIKKVFLVKLNWVMAIYQGPFQAKDGARSAAE